MDKRERLKLLSDGVAGCEKCPALAGDRDKVVFGEGNPDADLFVLGEAPGREEDRAGRPFVGESGRLLRRILAAAGWGEGDFYVTNVLKCRPPYNRDPRPREAENCRPYLNLQIQVARPKHIFCFGKVAAFYLLSPCKYIEDFKIGSVRRQVFEYAGAKVMCTYHPSYLLRDKTLRATKQVWGDIQFFKRNAII